MARQLYRAAASIALLCTVVACAPPPQAQSPAYADIAELWQEPVDLLERDLFWGPGGPALAPTADAVYEFVSYKTTGTNPGYDVRDAAGRLWSVKLGVEAQSEVTVSRLLWALGYHQPVTYYLPQFTLTGQDSGVRRAARFRTEVEPWRSNGEWSWYDNPFADTQPFRGLIVAQLLLNAWDLKTSNNRIYESADPGMQPSRRFVVRDVGASLGQARQFFLFHLLGTRGLQGSKNDLEDFERQGFIRRADGDSVEFDYRGMHAALVDMITPADVIWLCQRVARIPDEHLRAAFRAGRYPAEDTERYIAKIRQKVAQGLALATAATR